MGTSSERARQEEALQAACQGEAVELYFALMPLAEKREIVTGQGLPDDAVVLIPARLSDLRHARTIIEKIEEAV
jgi:hypothetical protein